MEEESGIGCGRCLGAVEGHTEVEGIGWGVKGLGLVEGNVEDGI